jgi:putative nucleotidyltransferase-like protein
VNLPSDVERAVCARLTGGRAFLTPEVIAAACRHRVHLLVADSVSAQERADPAVAQLTRELRTAAAMDVRTTETISDVLNGLAAAGIDALVLKGLGLAHSVYPASYLRVRTDTDLLIQQADLPRAAQVLAHQGWRHPVERDVELTAAQSHYMRGAGAVQHLDLHWRIANPLVFARTLSFAELRSRAIPLDPLGAHARTLGIADALFLACVHRVAHHDDKIQLLWLWDIHLLIQRASAEDRDAFLGLAGRERMCAVCRRGMELTAECFGTPEARDMADALRRRAGSGSEPSARFIRDARPVTALRSDLESISGWRNRIAYLAEHLFPSRAYIRSVYPSWPSALLPFAYGYRIARGAPKWFERPER